MIQESIMLKYALKLMRKPDLHQNLLKPNNFGCRKFRTFAKNDIFLNKLNNNHFPQHAFINKKRYSSNKVPVVFFGGVLTSLGVSEIEDPKPYSYEVIKRAILTLLGLQKPEEEESELILKIKQGILFIKRKQYDKSEKILHSALKLAQELQDEDGITYIYDILANLAFETKQYEKAEKLFVSVMQRLLAKGKEKDSNQMIEISLKMAKIFESTGQIKKAELGYKFCIESLDKKLDTQDQDTMALWGMSMDWYAKFLLRVNRLTESLNYLKKAYEMCVTLHGMEHEQTVILLNDLGTVSTLAEDYKSALHYLEKAKEIGKNISEIDDLASIYINLGQLYLLQEMLKEAKLACQDGLKLAKRQNDEVVVSEAEQCLEKIKLAYKTNQVFLKNRTPESAPLAS